MQGTMLYGPRDVRFEQRPDPEIIEPTGAIIKLAATCVCGSDLWSFRGIDEVTEPQPMGHEYAGIVEEVGSAVKNIKPGKVFNLTLPLDRVAVGYRAMDERRAIKTLLRP